MSSRNVSTKLAKPPLALGCTERACCRLTARKNGGPWTARSACNGRPRPPRWPDRHGHLVLDDLRTDQRTGQPPPRSLAMACVRPWPCLRTQTPRIVSVPHRVYCRLRVRRACVLSRCQTFKYDYSVELNINTFDDAISDRTAFINFGSPGVSRRPDANLLFSPSAPSARPGGPRDEISKLLPARRSDSIAWT